MNCNQLPLIIDHRRNTKARVLHGTITFHAAMARDEVNRPIKKLSAFSSNYAWFSGGGRWLRILRQTTARDIIFRSKLLRRVRQRRSYDVGGRDTYVLFPNTEASRQEEIPVR